MIEVLMAYGNLAYGDLIKDVNIEIIYNGPYCRYYVKGSFSPNYPFI
jgi:hypothetical protein